MAKKPGKTASKTADKTEEIIDAEVVEEVQPDAEEASVDAPEQDEPVVVEIPEDTEAMVAGEAELPLETEPQEAEQADDIAPVEQPEPMDEPANDDIGIDGSFEESPQDSPAESATPIVVKRTGFMPVFLGGVCAAAIGFGAALYLFPEGVWQTDGPSPFEVEATTTLKTQADEIAALKAGLAKAAGQKDIVSALSGVTTQLDEMQATLSRLDGTVGGFDARITDLEKRPLSEAVSPAAIAAYEREVKALQEAVATQRSEAEAMEGNARESARSALGRSAMTRVVSALDSGVPYRAALTDLASATGITAPSALAQFADEGVPTRAALEDAFPEAARAALAKARKTDSETEGGSRLGTFLKNQLGARSVSPREGEDADAILSRSEAALREGRLADSLAELGALPDAAAAEMAEWAGVAQSRAEALQAAETIAQSLNSN